MLRLYTIPMSHYAEKARFALVRAGLPWEEERHAQGVHYLTSLRVGRSLYLPILRDGRQTICDSTEILRHLDTKLPRERRLFGDDPEIARLEDDFDRGLGIHTRRLVYFYGTQMPDAFLSLACQGTPEWERRFLSTTFRIARRFAFARLDISASEIDHSADFVRRVFDDVARRLVGRYLVGDRFSAADLGFACMAAPVVLPEEYGVRLPTPADLPPELAALVRDLRTHPAGQFVLRLFREERRAC